MNTYRTVILRIPIDQLDAAREHIHATVPQTLGEGVEHVDDAGEVTAVYFDLPWRDTYFQRLIDEAAQFGASYAVRRNPRTNDDGESIDPTAESMAAFAAEYGETRAQVEESL